MNLVIWILCGAILGWIFFSMLRTNVQWGLVMSIVIGVVGGFFGGNVLSPMLGAVTDRPNDFSLISMTLALASAAVFLLVSDQVSKYIDL